MRTRPGTGHHEVGRAVLVTVRVPADDDRVGPARHEPRDAGHHDRLAEHHAAEDVADRAVRRPPHLLQAELGDAVLVRRDGGALDADAVPLDRVGGVDRHLIVRRVAVLDGQVVVLKVNLEIRQDQLVLDELPDDPRHLVAVELDDGVDHLYLRHAAAFPSSRRRRCHGGSLMSWGLPRSGLRPAGRRQERPAPRHRQVAAVTRASRPYLAGSTSLASDPASSAPAITNVPPRTACPPPRIVASPATTPARTIQYGSCGGRCGARCQPWRSGWLAASWLACPGLAGQRLRRMLHRASSGTQLRPRSPMYSLSGLISRLSACCSMTCAVHPAIRLAEKTGVNRSVGMPR